MSEKTEWKGLWKNREGIYSGQTIKKSDIPNYARLIVRYNKFYESDSNKPRFVYCFANGDSANAITIERTKEEYWDGQELVDLKEKVEDLADIMRRGNRNADVVMLPSESQYIAESLIKSAIEIIEDITGEKWDFRFLTWG